MAAPTVPIQQRRQGNLRRERAFWTILSGIILLIFLFVLLMPFVWMIITTFKPRAEMTNPDIAPFEIRQPTLENFQILFNDTEFVNWFFNSVTVSLLTTVFAVSISTMAAYALVRFRFWGARTLGLTVFITYLVPPTLLFVPMAYVIRQLGLYNNLWALVVVYPTIMVPFCTWLLMGFFQTIPRDMEECARVDGASYWLCFFKIVLPMARPGIVSAAIFTFTLSWSEYLYALVLVPSTSRQTLPVGIPSSLQQTDFYIWGAIMAAALLGSLPVAIVYSFSMKAFVSGLTAGAVKG